jgi:hypothetical protein
LTNDIAKTSLRQENTRIGKPCGLGKCNQKQSGNAMKPKKKTERFIASLSTLQELSHGLSKGLYFLSRGRVEERVDSACRGLIFLTFSPHNIN